MILTVSRLYPAKRVDVLIEATRRLIDQGFSVKLLVIGEGPEKAGLHSLVHRLGLAQKVVFEGAVPEIEIQKYFTAADVFAFAAPDEPWGLVVLEAMTYGLPVVVPDKGGLAEMIQDGVTGLQVSGGRPESYAERLKMILENPRLARRIKYAAQSLVRERFTIERMVDSLEAFYLRTHESCPRRV